MSFPPRFSILLPVHNGGEYLPLAVQSVLDQTRPDWNLVILENGSDDGTAQWLETLRDPRISVVASSETLAIEANWQRILQVPCGEFVTFLGHDDLLDPWYLEEMELLIAQQPDASLFQSEFRLIDSAGSTLRPALAQPARETASEFLRARLRRERESFGTGYLMRARDYGRVGGIPDFPGLLFADDALWIELSRLSFKATSPRECFAYRVHTQSSSAAAAWKIHLDAMARYLVFLREFARREPEIGAILQENRDYFLWHAHTVYLVALTQATRQNRCLSDAEIAQFNILLASVEPEWTIQSGRSRGMRIREAINRFGILRTLYNRVQKQRYGI